MLQAEHKMTSYAQPTFRRETTKDSLYEQFLRRIQTSSNLPVRLRTINLNDSKCAGLDDFMRQHEADRHNMTLRKIRGESLSPPEEYMLSVLNAELERHLRSPEERPTEVTHAVEEAKRLLAELENVDD